ncbi:hypothetical protein NP493_160g01008 [Ridgeia piscesae]|uniref:Uncharacterized protein n=1 Tax=Ridgeia piscesae TaxID=27915 RepID=A0AAD9P402_RIDPI|nr:hypothetical protein NP493_160g01008 [Ridgeia piscesae]
MVTLMQGEQSLPTADIHALFGSSHNRHFKVVGTARSSESSFWSYDLFVVFHVTVDHRSIVLMFADAVENKRSPASAGRSSGSDDVARSLGDAARGRFSGKLHDSSCVGPNTEPSARQHNEMSVRDSVAQTHLGQDRKSPGDAPRLTPEVAWGIPFKQTRR